MTATDLEVLSTLEAVITDRIRSKADDSYTASLVAAGQKRVAQKVGEEAVELVLASTSNNRLETINEAADLFYHVLVLLSSQDIKLREVVEMFITVYSIICELQRKSLFFIGYLI